MIINLTARPHHRGGPKGGTTMSQKTYHIEEMKDDFYGTIFVIFSMPIENPSIFNPNPDGRIGSYLTREHAEQIKTALENEFGDK